MKIEKVSGFLEKYKWLLLVVLVIISYFCWFQVRPILIKRNCYFRVAKFLVKEELNSSAYDKFYRLCLNEKGL